MSIPITTNHLPRISWRILKENKKIAWIMTIAFLPGVLFAIPYWMWAGLMMGLLHLLTNDTVVKSSVPFFVNFFMGCVNVFASVIAFAYISQAIDGYEMGFMRACSIAWDRSFALVLIALMNVVIHCFTYLPGSWSIVGYLMDFVWSLISVWLVVFLALTQKPLSTCLSEGFDLFFKTVKPFWFSYVVLNSIAFLGVCFNIFYAPSVGAGSNWPIVGYLLSNWGWLGFGGVALVLIVICSMWFMVLQVAMYRYFTDPAEDTVSQDSRNQRAA